MRLFAGIVYAGKLFTGLLFRRATGPETGGRVRYQLIVSPKSDFSVASRPRTRYAVELAPKSDGAISSNGVVYIVELFPNVNFVVGKA